MVKKNLAIILVILFGLEIMIRVLGVAPKLPLNYDIWQSHSVFGFITQPGIERKITLPNNEATFYVKHNSLGFRDSEPVNPKILLLGDSFTYGWGVAQGGTFADLMEDSLNMEVMNAGVPGYWPEKEVKLLDWLPYHFDYIFMCITPSDLIDIGQGSIKVNKNGHLAIKGPGVLRYLNIAERIYENSHLGRIIIKVIANNYKAKITETDRQMMAKIINEFTAYNKGVIIILNALTKCRLPDFIGEQIYINLPRDCYFKEGHLNQKGHREVAKLLTEWLKNKIKNQR